MVEKDPEAYKQAVIATQEASLSGKLPVYANASMLRVAHEIRRRGGVNTVISDGEKSRLVKMIHQISNGNSPFEEENIRSSLPVGSKKDPNTWYKIFQNMGINKGDRFYGVEDTEANAIAMAQAARQVGVTATVYLLDNRLSPNQAVKDSKNGITRIGSAEYLEAKVQRHTSYAAKTSSREPAAVAALFIVSLALLEFL